MKRETWEKHYENDCDHLFVGVHPMSDARLYKLDDISAYLNKEGEIKGILIEYYKSDFKKRYKKLIQELNS